MHEANRLHLNIDKVFVYETIKHDLEKWGAEPNNILIKNPDIIEKNTTNLEIHPSFLLGIMGNQIVYPENNQLPRNLFSCGQSKQAVSLFI